MYGSHLPNERVALSQIDLAAAGDPQAAYYPATPSKQVQVVKCLLEAETSKTSDASVAIDAHGSPVEPLPEEYAPKQGDVKGTLKYVLAAPILNEDGSIWGVVDFDSSNDIGDKQLKTKVAKSVLLLRRRRR